MYIVPFDIAGRNLADPTNMKAAMRLAVRMALGRMAIEKDANQAIGVQS